MVKAAAASLLLALSFVSCGASKPAPDMTAMLQFSRLGGVAHGCPIATDMALTNRHVVSFKIEPDSPVVPLRWSQQDNPATNTEFKPVAGNPREDIVIGILSPKIDRFYKVAMLAPGPGDDLYWVAYDWRNKKDAFAERPMHGKLVRIVAGQLIIDTETFPGSSGSCVLNSDGEVVGIIGYGMGLDKEGEEVSGALAVYGNWLLGLIPDKKDTEEQK